MQLNIPTYLTLVRIALIPVLMIVFYLPGKWMHLASAVIFTLAAITDWLDGYLARKLNQTTAFGAFLDPVADKLMVAAALILLVQADPQPLLAIPAIVITGREIAVTALREWMAEAGQSKKVEVSWLGKLKTVTQMIAIITLLVGLDVPWEFITVSGYVMLYIAAILTLWSMVNYLKAVLPALSEKN